MLPPGAEQSFIAIKDSRHIHHPVSLQEVIDFFFSRFVSSDESIDQGGSAAVYRRTDAKLFLLKRMSLRGVSAGLPTGREVGAGTGMQRVLEGSCCCGLAGSVSLMSCVWVS